MNKKFVYQVGNNKKVTVDLSYSTESIRVYCPAFLFLPRT